MSHERTPLLALCPGEPAGIGPDIAVGAAQRNYQARIACFADPSVITARAECLGVDLSISEFESVDSIPRHRPGHLAVIPSRAPQAVIAGQLDPDNAHYVLGCLDGAISAAREGQADCIVTGPVHKGVINDAGIPFTGHTEYLGLTVTPIPRPVMMLSAAALRVALVTTHLPLRSVADALTSDAVRYVIETVAENLRRRFGIPRPRIAVCGLNPHAGENGHFGNEDATIIAPAIQAAARCGATLSGPLPADTAFTPPVRKVTDAYVTMYHDQGLPVVKALGFGEVVNITLGLPILRTSVDHGTALDLAGTGRARCGSLEAALDEAVRLSILSDP